MKLLNFSIIKLTACLIFGILLAYYIDFTLFTILLIAVILLTLYTIGLLVANQRLGQPLWVGIILLATMTSLGSLSFKLHEQRNFKNHYSKYSLITKDTSYTIQFRIREILKPSNYHNKYIIDVLSINNISVSGKSLLNVEKDTIEPIFKVDDILISNSSFNTISTPLNPHQFDYKNYLSKKYIYHQLILTHKALIKIDSTKHTLFGYAALLRENINKHLDNYNFKDSERSIINALLLGQRQDISKEIYDSYTQAGVIHILAVSGLHVGIILLLLNFIFKPLDYFKKGNYIKILIVLGLLWSYAIIAGLSASVIRAVSMFSIVAVAMHLKRPTNIYNTLAISMFVLLLFKPTFIFDVGFQLSYLAVLAIVVMQPILYNLWLPKYKVLDFFWKIFTVTLAAQVGVIPISLYYFHQFPGLFFISNLVIIPCLSLILGLGLLIISLSLLNILPIFLANIYGWIISAMNVFVSWVSNQEAFLFKNISFSIGHVLLSYMLIISVIILIKQKTYKSMFSVLMAILLFQSYLIFNSYNSSSSAFIVFHKSRYSAIGTKQNKQLNLYNNIENVTNEKLITNFKVGEDISTITSDSIRNVYAFNGKKMLIIDSIGVYNVKSFRPDIILLRNSPKLNLERLIDTLRPELIISDGSNYKTYQERWAATCRTKKIPFHQTSKKGAFIYRY